MSIISECPLDKLKQLVTASNSIKELQIKLGYSPNSGVTETIRSYCESQGISLEHFTHTNLNRTQRTEENIFIENSTASQKVLRDWYRKGHYSEYKCAICGQEPFWNNKELSLTLDHINGINTDDRLQNLRWICPNCDRQLDTFCSKNNRRERINKAQKHFCQNCGAEIASSSNLCIKCYGLSQRKVDRPVRDELEKILIENKGNFTKVGSLFSVSDNTIRKWCKGYGLPYRSRDYK